jgi:hypothetical protein
VSGRYDGTVRWLLVDAWARHDLHGAESTHGREGRPWCPLVESALPTKERRSISNHDRDVTTAVIAQAIEARAAAGTAARWRWVATNTGKCHR